MLPDGITAGQLAQPVSVTHAPPPGHVSRRSAAWPTIFGDSLGRRWAPSSAAWRVDMDELGAGAPLAVQGKERVRQRTATVTLLVVLVSFGVLGCHGPERTAVARQAPERDLLFSPSWVELPTFDVARSSWPCTTAFGQVEEVVNYRERIIDRQGWFGSQRDFYYRRFDAVRAGRARR